MKKDKKVFEDIKDSNYIRYKVISRSEILAFPNETYVFKSKRQFHEGEYLFIPDSESREYGYRITSVIYNVPEELTILCVAKSYFSTFDLDFIKGRMMKVWSLYWNGNVDDTFDEVYDHNLRDYIYQKSVTHDDEWIKKKIKQHITLPPK